MDIPITFSQDLNTELRTFILNSERLKLKTLSISPFDVTKSGLNLIKNLPSAKNAVLDFFCTIIDMSVAIYINEIETNRDQQNTSNSGSTSQTFPDDSTISEIHSTLSNFVTSNPESWAPIISTWSLELLGYISSKYAVKAKITLSSGLGESLQLWMSCRATRTLIDLTTQCLSSLMSADTESCINALLDVSVQHSPHFDWVVAHVGSCFPRTVVTRVLSCGLKESYQQGINQPNQRAFTPFKFDNEASKLNSVVGILSHLASSHFSDIKTALVDLFKWCLEVEVDNNDIRVITIPYLLHLASLSPTLLKALSADALQSLQADMLPKLGKLAPIWCEFFGGVSIFQSLVVHLILGCETGGSHAFKLLLDAAGDKQRLNDSQREACSDTVELLLQEMSGALRHNDPTQVSLTPMPLLTCIRKEFGSLQPMLLSDDSLQAYAAMRLVTIMAQHSITVPLLATSFLLSHSTEDYHLGTIKAICKRTAVAQQNLLSDALEQELRCPEGRDHSRLWKNLARLLRDEINNEGFVVEATRKCFPAIAESVRNGNSDAAEVLELSLPPPHGVELSLKLTHATITYFFLSLETENSIQRLIGSRRSVRLLSKLCSESLPARALAIRELLNLALHRSQSRLFGAVIKKIIQPCSLTAQPALLNDNQKQGVSALLPQRHSNVFHAGIIGQGPRKILNEEIPSPAQVSSNCQLLIEIMRAACSTDGDLSKPLVPEAVADMALTLVELISPDVMYNGLPWPEEEFAKVTVERDLHIRRILEDRPVAWELLRFAATQRPALCYCSVLLRAYTASLIAQWSCSPGPRPSILISQTQQLLDLMALGQLIPNSLASARHLLPDINSSQVILLLKDVWNYLKDNVPDPGLYKRDLNTGVAWRDNLAQLPQYTECLRLTMQSHLETLGGVYAQVFVKPQLGESNFLSS